MVYIGLRDIKIAMFYWFSSLVLVIIAAGLYFRKRMSLHIPLMITAFVIDLSLVLVIEFQRMAVEKVIGHVAAGTDYFLIFHAGISLLVLVCYSLLIWTGSKVYKGMKAGTGKPRDIYDWHKKLAVAFIILRLINYVTSFGV